MSRDRDPEADATQSRAVPAERERSGEPDREKPLKLDDLDHLPTEQRFEALLMRTTGEVPMHVALVREIRACRQVIESSTSEEQRERARLAIREKLAELQANLKQSRLP